MDSPIIIPQNLTYASREYHAAIKEVHYQADGIYFDVLDEIKGNVLSRVPQGAPLVERERVYRALAKEGFEKWKNLVSERFKDNPSARDILLVRTERYYWFRFLKYRTFKAPLEEIFHKAYPSAPDIANLDQKV